jgi:hypothetical protein
MAEMLTGMRVRIHWLNCLRARCGCWIISLLQQGGKARVVAQAVKHRLDRAFFTGTDFVTFDPYFKEFNNLLGCQWLITYRSTNTGPGFRRIEVITDADVPLYHPAGYRARSEDQSRR